MTIAFICTDYVSGWDPLCNGGHLVALIISGLFVGLSAAYLMTRNQQWHLLMKLFVGVATVVLSAIVVMVLGFQL